MGSLNNPKTWVPYMQSKDCTQGFCSVYCPQWCYIIFPPPPPFEFPDENSGPNFSPLVIAIIGILASAFLLVSYYTIISKYCGNSNASSRENSLDNHGQLEDNHNGSLHEPWQAATAGLDEALIKSITMCKYKKGDGLIEGIDCSVCLSEFVEDESVRLLPKCSHAFHVQCIDTWLKSHSNCPLCRANIISIGVNSQPPSPVLVVENPTNDQNVAAFQVVERSNEEQRAMQHSTRVAPKSPLRVFSDLGNLEERHTIIEIRDEGYRSIRRSVSMDHSSYNQARILAFDLLQTNQEEDYNDQFTSDVGSPKQKQVEASNKYSRPSSKRAVNFVVMSPVKMKRSFSSGRFLLTRQGRVQKTNMPL